MKNSFTMFIKEFCFLEPIDVVPHFLKGLLVAFVVEVAPFFLNCLHEGLILKIFFLKGAENGRSGPFSVLYSFIFIAKPLPLRTWLQCESGLQPNSAFSLGLTGGFH